MAGSPQEQVQEMTQVSDLWKSPPPEPFYFDVDVHMAQEEETSTYQIQEPSPTPVPKETQPSTPVIPTLHTYIK